MAPISAESILVLVTGANSGIGYAIAMQLASEDQSCHVILAGRNSGAVEKAVAGLLNERLSVESLVLDISNDESIAKAATHVEHKYGRIDVLINNAGITQRYADSTGMSRRMIMQTVFDTNVFGTYETTEAFVPLLAKSSKIPRIVFVSSSVGSLQMRTDPKTVTRATPFTEYPSSKAALNMLCLHYAVKYEKEGWKVNASCPGLCKTHLNGFTRGDPPELGAQNACRLARLGSDGETGTFSDRSGPLPW